MQTDILDLMKELLFARGIQVILLSELKELRGRIDYDFRRELFSRFEYEDYLKELSSRLSPGVLYHIEDDFRLSYSILFFPENDSCYAGKYLFAGPVRFQAMNLCELQSIIDEKEVPLSLRDELSGYYSRIPLWDSFDSWAASISIFCSKISDKELSIQTCTCDELFTQGTELDYSSPAHTELSRSTIEARYEAESRFMAAVASGNADKALAAFSGVRHYRLEARTPDALRNTKNLYVILNTLLRKSAQQGHVHPLHIDNLSRQMAIQIESATSLSAMESFPAVMIRKYCILVQNYSRRKHSPLVRFCLDYIDFHYMEEIGMSALAEKCSVSGSYLSALFSKELGMTLTGYILQARINRALVLLNTSTSSIQEIAASCGFSDPNYFTRVFKKTKGISPRQYRQLIKNN